MNLTLWKMGAAGTIADNIDPTLVLLMDSGKICGEQPGGTATPSKSRNRYSLADASDGPLPFQPQAGILDIHGLS